MLLLKELHREFRKGDWDMPQRDRYVALRHEVAEKLMPLFADLDETGMLLLWTHGPTINNHNHSTIDDLALSGENSGIQLVKKEK